MSPRSRPLLVRPGARFACHGDGLCCTDLHRLGPIADAEARALVPPSSLVRDPELDAIAMRTTEGACVELDVSGCALHRRAGADAKPSPCRRFPFGLVATPDGGRITTDHRCPCRTIGERPPIAEDEARAALVDRRARLVADRRVERIRLRGARSVGFARYLAVETSMLDALAQGGSIEAVLDAEPFPELDGFRYEDLAAHLRHPVDATTGAAFLVLAGDELARALGLRVTPTRTVPGAAAFERATTRAPSSGDPDAMLRDFVADTLWSLAWTDDLDLARLRVELASRVALARSFVRRRRRVVRADRAMAEAIAMIELLGLSAPWRFAMARAIAPR